MAQAGSCNFTTPGAATCAIPAGVTSVNVVATGGGGGGGSLGGNGGGGGVVTATLTGVGGTTLTLFIGGGGRRSPNGIGGGGGSSNVNAGTPTQIIAGGGGGGGGACVSGRNGTGGNGNGGGGGILGGGGGTGGTGGNGNGGGGGGNGNGGGGGTGGNSASNGGSGSNGGGFGGNGDGFGGGGGGGFGGGGGGTTSPAAGGLYCGAGGGGGSTGGVLTVLANGGIGNSNGNGNGTSNGGNGSIEITWNTTVPSFIGPNPGALVVAENSVATDVKGLLHVSDVDAGQTETWTQFTAPSHGTLSFAGATAGSGSADITPGGTITYTPTAGYAGTDSFLVQVSDGTNTATKTVNVTVNGLTPAPSGIPLFVTPPVVANLTTAVTAKDLSSGDGPSMTGCLANALSTLLAGQATYQGQRTDGSAWISVASNSVQLLSYYPVDANTNSGSPAFTLSNTNRLTVASSCGTFTTVPALFNSREFATLASAMGLSLNINAQGVITGQSGNTIFVVRPDYVVTKGTAGSPSLVLGFGGLYRFSDSAGNVQILRPAFLEPEALNTALAASYGSSIGSLVIQFDASALLTLSNGSVFALTPSFTLSPVPSAHATDNVWSDALGSGYRVYSFPNASQGVTLSPQPR